MFGHGECFAQNLCAAVAGPDDANADAVVGAEDVGRRQGAGQAGGELTDEIAAGMHGDRDSLTACGQTPAQVQKTIIYVW